MNSYKLVYASESDITADKFWNNVDYAWLWFLTVARINLYSR